MNKIKKLTIINKKEVSLTVIFYAGMLHKNLTKWQELLQKHEILTHLIKELVIMCSKNLTLNYNYFITQVIENINKMKNNFIKDNMITTR